ncbi:MAG: cobalt-precorrin-7 (C(5))-methyltransferase [Halolamina sp.]
MSDDYDLDAGPDPATRAAAAPEPTDPTDPSYAVGVGPGAPEYLLPRAARALREADVVVGFGTVVDVVDERASVGGVADGVVDGTETELLRCGYRDEAETLSTFADRVADGATGTAVLMGDPNHSGYQFLGKVEAAVDRPVRVVPGVSSLQVAASRARTPMEATTFVTLHKSGSLADDLARLRADAGERHLLVLPRPYDWMPGDVAAHLLDAGADPSLSALVMERLTYETERLTRTTLGELATEAGGTDEGSTRFSDLSVLAVRAD